MTRSTLAGTLTSLHHFCYVTIVAFVEGVTRQIVLCIFTYCTSQCEHPYALKIQKPLEQESAIWNTQN